MVAGSVTIVVEGDSDARVVARLIEHAGLTLNHIHIQRGKGNLDKKLPAYNNAARYAPWLVIRDLDDDAPCAAELVRQILPDPAPHMRFRIAVRAVEAWLLADRENVIKFLRVASHQVPVDPENLTNPKRALVDVARRSRDRAIHEDMVPLDGTSNTVGPGYVTRLIEFATDFWNPDVAATRSDSLRRCIEVLQQWAGRSVPSAATVTPGSPHSGRMKPRTRKPKPATSEKLSWRSRKKNQP